MAELPQTPSEFSKTDFIFHPVIDILKKNKKMPLDPVIALFTLSK